MYVTYKQLFILSDYTRFQINRSVYCEMVVQKILNLRYNTVFRDEHTYIV